MSDSKPVNPCLQCRHYYVTWDTRFPYGCRAMGFKSRQSPYLDVVEASGNACMKFQPKAGQSS